MAIGDKVRAAEEAKAEAALNEEGKLSGRQLKALVEKGMAIGDARALAADGVGFDELLVIAETQAQRAQATASGSDLASAISKGINEAKEPIPEQKQHHGISDRNPFGELHHPTPELRCEWWWGVIDDKTQDAKQSGSEIDPTVLTVWEIMALNVLEPMRKTIKRLDRADMNVVVAEQRGSTGNLRFMVLAFPANVISKASHENRNMVPDLTEIVRQLTGHDFRPESLSAEETKRLMAEHRNKNYDVPRKAVAA